MDDAHRTVRQLPNETGPAAWNALLPNAKRRASLDENRWADWVIVGAGFTGLSAARRLAELHPSANVVVLDAIGIAQGAAGRNSGFMIDLPHVLTSNDYSSDEAKDRIDTRLNRAGIEYAMAAKHEFGMSDEAIALSGKINGAVSSRGVANNDQYAQHLNALNEPFERYDAEAMQAITGTDTYVDGIFNPGTAMIQPALFIRNCADAIESNRIRLYEHSPVTQTIRSNGIWTVSTPHGSVDTPHVILAVNGHLESFGICTDQLMHIVTYASMTERLSDEQIKRLGGHKQWALTPADPLGTTVRRINGGAGERLIIRNRVTFNPSLSASDAQLKSAARTHLQSFKDRFPMLNDVRMEHRWGGRLCLSRNDVPVFGEVEPGLFAACCQNGLGTAKGTISGKLIAEYASGMVGDLINDLIQSPEPVRLPPKPIAKIGANAVLRWGEWRAGREL